MQLTFIGTRGEIDARTRRHSEEREISAKLRTIAAEGSVEVRIAYDGMKVTL
jgi:hypothetical protein